MNTLYWITRFDSINNLALIVIIASLIVSLVFCGMSLINDDYTGEDVFNDKQKASLREKAKYFFMTFIIGVLTFVFTPTTKEALLIYGVGGTIDYIKENPVAKELPDKCILALDKWASTLIENNDTTNNN